MEFTYSEIVQGKLNPVSRLYYVILISTGHGVFFIDLQDMYQIKEIEPFWHYRLFCGIWQRPFLAF